ncbi:MliC family protein [Streptobacillus moniliformis]|uniref:MliC family protein n=1 Tax=Streptobacillus moniliformis TaxID=34105 RepID=UPI0007E41EB6|nr:MliC family protein [Streptobacillus moniliformis]QXW65076.1 MliC family protein [Streptobacillus moniliformis]
MKKMMIIPVILLAVNGFANSNTMMNTNKMVKEEKVAMEMMHEEVRVDLLGSEGQNAMAILNGDMALLSINGEKYSLKRMKSASGEMFSNDDKTVVLGIKGKDAFVRMNDKVMGFNAMQEMVEEIVLNYHSVRGEAHSHVLVIIKGDHAFVRVDGMEHDLERIVSASGEMFANADKTVVLGIKGTEAFVEKDGKVANYFQVGKASKGYARGMEEEHK